jgi:hypothetical protein
MKRKTIFAFLIILLVTIAAKAQQKKEVKRNKDGTIENTEVIIEKNKKIVLPEADRNFEKISTTLPKPQPEAQQYNITEPKLQFPDLKINFVLPAPIEEEPQPQSGNYARIGAGNYGATLGEVFLGNTRHQSTQIGFHAKHIGYLSGPKDGQNSASGDQQIKITGKYFRQQLTTYASLAYHRQQVYFYGYQSESKPLRDTLKQVFNSFELNTGIQNRLLDSLLGFKADLNLSHLSDRFAARELESGLQISGDYLLTSAVTLLLHTNIFLTQRQDENVSQNRSLFRLKPRVQFTKNNFRATLGFNFVAQNDSLPANTRIYPLLEAHYNLSEKIEIFAGFSGDVERNTLRSFMRENLWLAPKTVLLNTEKVSELSGGIKAIVGKKFSAKFDFSFGQFRNLAFFVGGLADTTKFSVVYEEANPNSKIFQGNITLAYQSEKWQMNLKTSFYNYQLPGLGEAIHRPRITGTLNAKYFFNKKLTFSTDCYYFGGIFAKTATSYNFFSLPDVVDLNVKADYTLNNKINFFIALNNILAQQYQRYLYYQQRGIQVLLGLDYHF